VRWVTVIALLFVAGCDCSGGGNPCTTCPPVSGTWVFQYDTGMSTGCEHTGLDALPTSMVIDQQQSVLHADLGGAQLSGSLFDTYDFRLNGSISSIDGGFDLVIQLRGLYVPAQSPGGGDDRIEEGLFSRSVESCQEDTPFKAIR
jgi:hypothetical protein